MLDLITTQEKLKEIEASSGKAGIAIIDDDRHFSFMLKDYLDSTAGFKSDAYFSGEEFLAQYNSNDVRKIILDYDFGTGMNGLGILEKIKAINPIASVIMVSA